MMPDKIQFIIASPAHLPEHDWLDEKVFEVKKIVTTLKSNMSQIIKPYFQEDVRKFGQQVLKIRFFIQKKNMRNV